MRDFAEIAIAQMAAIVAEHLLEQGVEVVLVGGLAVEIYTDNLYLTKDIDMVNTNFQPAARLNSAMAGLGFAKQGRVYVNPTTDIVVEFLRAPLSVGDELITSSTHCEVAGRRIPILTADDVIKDRLAAFMHWQDNPSLIQAIMVMLKHQRAPQDFELFCQREGSCDDYALALNLYAAANQQVISTMAQLEPMLTQLLIERL